MPLLPLWSFIKEMFFNKAAATPLPVDGAVATV